MDTRELAKRIRLHVLRMTNRGGSAHIGSNFSIADILGVLFGAILQLDPKNPKWEDRDRFILSKGHAGASIYAALAEKGFFPIEKLDTHYQNGSDLCGHVAHKNNPGVELSTGALGHGFPVAIGMAIAGKHQKKTHKVVTILGDGECDEGSNWEAAMYAPHHKLDNLTVIIDYNKIQSLDTVENTLGLEPFTDKWRSFGWEVVEVDGHDHDALLQVFSHLPAQTGKPTCVIAHTIKGKGVSFMEDTVLWHYRTARDEEYDAAKQELNQ